MSFCLEDQKPQPPEPPSPPLGLFFLGTSGRDLGEQFCTDGFCQEVQARISGHGECSCRKQISSGNTLKRRCFWPATPKPAGTSRNFLSLPGPGRKLHYKVDPDRLATSVSRDQLKRRSLGQAQPAIFLVRKLAVADTKKQCPHSGPKGRGAGILCVRAQACGSGNLD